MAGLTLQQLQAMGAKPSSSGGLTLEQLQAMGATPAQKEPNLYEQIVSGVAQRAKNIYQSVKDVGQAQGTVETVARAGQVPLRAIGQTAGAVADVVGGVVGKGLEVTGLDKPLAEIIQTVSETAPAKVLTETYGKLPEEVRKSLADVGNVAGVVTGSRTAPSVVKPAVSGAIKTGEAIDTGISGISRFTVSQASGLSPESIKTIVKNPQFFTKENMAKFTREDLANEVKSSIDTKLSELSDIGSGYNSIRELNTVVEIAPQSVQNVLSKYGIGVENGKLKVSAETKPFSNADLGEIQNFLTQYGDIQLSPNGFLNVREKLAQMAKYDMASGKTSNLSKIAKDLRIAYNEVGRPQIAGLKELDNLYEPEVKILSKIKKDYLTPEGNFKDNAVTKIANLNNKGRELVLERLKQIIPDIDEKIAVVKVIEDIDNAFGQKVGTYGRAALAGGSIATGNIPLAVAGIILSYPKTSIPLLRATGYTRQQITKGINIARNWANDVNNPRSQVIGDKLKSEAKKVTSEIKQKINNQ